MRNVLAATKWATTSRGVAFSAALTVGVVVLILLTSGRAGAVGLTVEGLDPRITQGQSHNFVLDLEIPQNELIPIQSLELTITGTGTASGTNLNVKFDAFANSITTDPHLSVSLCQATQSGPGVGYGYRVGDAHGYGYDDDDDGAFDFAATGGYGYGYVSGFLVSDFRYCVTLNTGASPPMPTGSYNVQFILNTGETVKATFSSGIPSFNIVAPPPSPPPPPPPPPPAPTPTPTPASEGIQKVIDRITGLTPEAAAVALELVASESVVAAVLEEIDEEFAAAIINNLPTTKVGTILGIINVEKAASLLARADVEKAAAGLQQTDRARAALIIEEMTIEKAAELIGEMDETVAGEIISKIGTLTGADIIEELPVGQAGNIMEKVEPKAGGAIMGEVDAQTRIGLINILSEESLTNILSETPVKALLELPLQTLFDRLPNVPASSLAITDPPPVDPNLPPPIATQVSPTLAIYESQTGELTWVTLVNSPAPVDQILGKFARALPGVTISVENIASKPADVPALPDGQSAIEYFRVSMEGAEAEDLLAVHITFYVLKDVLEAGNLHKWSILLNRFDDASGQWVAYDATRVREDDEKVFYSAVVPGFSLFAISGDVEPTPVRFQVSELTVSPAQAREGREITIHAIVRNVSAEERTFQANLWLNNTIGATQAVVLGAGESQTVTFTITGEVGATEVRIDRLLDSFTVLAGILSDLNDDQVVDVRDLAILASAFNTSQGQAGYLSIADLSGDGVIDLRDLAIMAANFGRGG